MKRNVLVFGTISGLIVATLMIGSMAIMGAHEMDMEYSMLVGYASMLLSFSLIFVAIKNYRDKYNNGEVTFGKAFRIGLYISLIASTIYVIAWAIDYHFFMPDFMESYSAQVIKGAKESGATPEELAKKMAELAEGKEMYKNPVWFTLFTYLEILPVGLLISLISALILKQKQKKELNGKYAMAQN